MKAEIDTRFPLTVGQTDDFLGDLVDFEDKIQQSLNEMEELETEHGVTFKISTTTSDGEELLKIQIDKA